MLYEKAMEYVTPALILPVALLYCLFMFFLYYLRALRPRPGTSEWIKMEVNKTELTLLSIRRPMDRSDIIPLALIAAAFAALAFFRLDDSAVFSDFRTLLGNAIITLSVHAFGIAPLPWLFVKAVFGILMLVVMYVFIKNMFGRTAAAVCGTLLLGFEFTHFTLSQSGSPEFDGVFFILLAYYFMYRHITTPPEAKFRKSLAPLALSGLAVGFGCVSDWTAPFAFVGLALIIVIRLIHLRKHYKKNKTPGFGAYLVKTLLFTVLFFGVVPIAIYCLCCIPYVLSRGIALNPEMLLTPAIFDEVLKIAWDDLLLKISYINTGGIRSSLGVFGNPLVLWGGLVAMLLMVYRVFRYRDGKALFILIGFLSQFAPFIPVPYITLMYHYFPCSLFLVLALAHIFDTILGRRRGNYKLAIYGFTAGAGVVFALFYPLLAGISMPQWYFQFILQWIPEFLQFL